MGEEKKINDRLEQIIEKIMIKAFFKKFAFNERIYINSIYRFLKEKVGFVWLKERPFYSKAKKIYNRFIYRYSTAKRHKTIKEMERKYKKLQIAEAFTYLELKGKFKLKNEDLETFDEVLEILLAKLRKK